MPSVETISHSSDPHRSLKDRLKSFLEPGPLTMQDQAKALGDRLFKMQEEGLVATDDHVQQFLADVDEKGINWQVTYMQYIHRVITAARQSSLKA